MNVIRVIIVDDHEIVRHGLRSFLDLIDDIKVVGEGGTGRDAVALVNSIKPDVILMDMVMPDIDGVGAIKAIREGNPDARILILSSFSQDDKVLPALEAGASGYLLKDIAPDELAQAIRDTYAGESRLHPEVTRHLMAHIRRSDDKGDEAPHKDLTPRELEVLVQLARGLSNDEISVELSISSLTVKTHVSNILSKLYVSDRTQAALYAIRHGIAPLDP